MAVKRRSARWWRKQTEEWEAVRGEVTAREFARQRGFNAGTFSWWRRELRRKDPETSKSLVPVQVIEQRNDVKVMPASERWLEAELPDGIKFRFVEGTGVECVADLVVSVGRGRR